jgi:hypothetical protein
VSTIDSLGAPPNPLGSAPRRPRRCCWGISPTNRPLPHPAGSPHTGVCSQRWILYTRVTPRHTTPCPSGAPHRRRCWWLLLTKRALLHSAGEYDFRVYSNDIKSIPNFIQIHPSALELNHADGQTDERTGRQADMSSPICDLFMHIVQRTHKNVVHETPRLH